MKFSGQQVGIVWQVLSTADATPPPPTVAYAMHVHSPSPHSMLAHTPPPRSLRLALASTPSSRSHGHQSAPVVLGHVRQPAGLQRHAIKLQVPSVRPWPRPNSHPKANSAYSTSASHPMSRKTYPTTNQNTKTSGPHVNISRLPAALMTVLLSHFLMSQVEHRAHCDRSTHGTERMPLCTRC